MPVLLLELLPLPGPSLGYSVFLPEGGGLSPKLTHRLTQKQPSGTGAACFAPCGLRSQPIPSHPIGCRPPALDNKAVGACTRTTAGKPAAALPQTATWDPSRDQQQQQQATAPLPLVLPAHALPLSLSLLLFQTISGALAFNIGIMHAQPALKRPPRAPRPPALTCVQDGERAPQLPVPDDVPHAVPARKHVLVLLPHLEPSLQHGRAARGSSSHRQLRWEFIVGLLAYAAWQPSNQQGVAVSLGFG